MKYWYSTFGIIYIVSITLTLKGAGVVSDTLPATSEVNVPTKLLQRSFGGMLRSSDKLGYIVEGGWW